VNNLLSSLPSNLDQEVSEELLRSEHVRIERILSKGHTAPNEGWFDQDENEWVVVLEGSGTIRFADGKEVSLKKGDCLNIPSRTKHKVVWTDPGTVTVWLAVFYQ
jgi:cupin 2 domain-containing protein